MPVFSKFLVTTAAITLIILQLSITCQAAERLVRVGVYNNKPKIFMENGRAQGIFIDILEYVAQKEGWELEYKALEWSDGLEWLANGRIDIMPDVAITESRLALFDFNQLPMLTEWLQVYALKSKPIHTLADLNGKTVAVLESSVQAEQMESLNRKLSLGVRIQAVHDYRESARLLINGRVDAILASRFFIYSIRENYPQIAETPVIFHPNAVFVAVRKGHNQDLLEKVDYHYAGLRNDLSSVFYASLKHWLGEKPRTVVPFSLKAAITVIVVILFVTVLFILLLRREVARKTALLDQKNRELSRNLVNLDKLHMEAMRRERLFALGQMAAGVAHDFNSVLIPIKNYIDLLYLNPEKLDIPEHVRDYLDRIRNAADEGVRLNGHIMELLRSRNSTPQLCPLDLNKIIEETVELTRPRRDKAGSLTDPQVRIDTDLCSRAFVNGIRAEIREMLLNLVFNAIDALQNSGVIIIKTEETKGYVMVTVSDNGPGMDKETLENCRKPFFTTKGVHGTGMGLNVVQDIANRHGASLDIISGTGNGTTIKIEFPAATE